MTSVILRGGMCLKETFGVYSMTGRIYENFAYCSLFSLKVGSPFSVLLYSTLPGVPLLYCQQQLMEKVVETPDTGVENGMFWPELRS